MDNGRMKRNNLLLELADTDGETREALKALSVSGNEWYSEITGQEDFVSNALVIGHTLGSVIGTITQSAIGIAAVVGGKASAAVNTLFQKANRNIMVSYGTNGMGIKKLLADVQKDDPKADFEISASTVSVLTSTGKFTDFANDLSDLDQTLSELRKHCTEVDGYLQRRLSVLKEFKGVKTNDRAADLLNRIEAIVPVGLKLPNQPNTGTFVSEVMPGGKVLKCVKTSKGYYEYSMSGDKPAGETSKNPYGKAEWQRILQKLGSINETHKAIVKSNESYVKYIQAWTTEVKAISTALETMDDVSGTFKRDIERLLTSDNHYLLFYSGFLPRVIAYTNALIAEVLRLVTKLI